MPAHFPSLVPLPQSLAREPSASQLHAMIDALPDGCAILGADGRIRFVNVAFASLAGTAPRDLVGRLITDVVPALAGGSALQAMRETTADGRRRTVRVGAFAGGAYEASVAGTRTGELSLQLRDISAIRRSAEWLAERSEENASLREVARALAAEEDMGTLLEVICREAMALCDAAGATVGELLEGAVQVVAAAGIGAAAREFRFTLAGSLTGAAVELRAPRRSNDYRREFPHMSRALPQLDVAVAMSAPLVAHNQVLGVLFVARRTGDRPFIERDEHLLRALADHAALALWKTRMLERLREANRTQFEFMAVMSHELRTPLTALNGYAELLEDQVLGTLTEQQRSALARMRASTELLASIVDEILSFARLEAGKVVVESHACTVQEIVRATHAVLEPLAREKQLSLEQRLPAARVPLVTDSDMVRRILVNLGANAVKFTERGGVMLDATATDDEVRLMVRDTGIGIASDDLPRLFQPFTQLDGSLTRRHGGTGLGLYISQRLAGLLGGRIEVHSEPGVGSAFTLVLPRN